MKTKISLLSALALIALSLPIAADAVDYQEEIRPILNEKCFKCHTGPRAKGKLRMDSKDTFADRVGGDDPVIIPGDAARSLLVIKAGLPRDNGDAMPPPPARARGAEPMTSVELNLVKQWISLGAKFDASEMTEAAPTETPSNEVHSWTNYAGNTIEASFVRLEGTNVIIHMNGQDIPYALDKLNPESQALAKKLGGQ